MRRKKVKVGDWIEILDGVFEVIQIESKFGFECMVREVLFENVEPESYTLGEDRVWTLMELKRFLHCDIVDV